MTGADWRRKFGLNQVGRLAAVQPNRIGLAVLQAALHSDQRLDLNIDPLHMYEMIFFWPIHSAELPDRFNALSHHIDPSGAIWVIFPKKAQLPKSDVDHTWEQMQAAALTTDLVDNKVASFSDTHYGTRFVLRKAARPHYGKS